MRLLEKLEAACVAHGHEAARDCLVVSIGEQKLAHFRDRLPLAEYRVSTSRAEPSCVKDSLGTPSGLHRVVEKIGEGQPSGMVFKARQPQGWTCHERPETLGVENLITSRILRLEGLQPGHNQGGDRDTFARFVYVHGTNQEHLLGTPNSHGCVLLANDEIIRLFDIIPVGALLWIDDDRPGVVSTNPR